MRNTPGATSCGWSQILGDAGPQNLPGLLSDFHNTRSFPSKQAFKKLLLWLWRRLLTLVQTRVFFHCAVRDCGKVTFLLNLMQQVSTHDLFYHQSAFTLWPTIQAAAPMAPKVINIIHTPNTRQGVNTQVREIPLFPTNSTVFSEYTWNHSSLSLKKETKWFKWEPNIVIVFSNTIYWCVFKKRKYRSLLSLRQHADTATTKCLVSVHIPKSRRENICWQRLKSANDTDWINSPKSTILFQSESRTLKRGCGASRHVCTHTQLSHEPQFGSLLVIFSLTVNTRDFFIYSEGFPDALFVTRDLDFFFGVWSLAKARSEHAQSKQGAFATRSVLSLEGSIENLRRPARGHIVIFLINVLPNTCPDYFDLVSGHLIRQKLWVWIIHLEFVCFSVVSSRFSSFFPHSKNT